MGDTPTYALPYQDVSDPPHGPDLGRLLALAVEAELARIDAAVAAAAARRQFVRKTTDQTVNAQSTIVNDNELLAPVAINSTYTFDVMAFYSTNSTADIKFSMNFPAGAVCAWAPAGVKLNTVDLADFSTATWRASAGTPNPLAGDGASYNTARLKGILRTGATAGNLHLKWAQQTNNASNTTVKADSYMIVVKES